MNLFKILERREKGEGVDYKNTTILGKNTHSLRILSSFKVMLDSLPTEPHGCKFDSNGTLFVALGYKVAQISNPESIQPKQDTVFPDRLLGRECDLIYGVNFVNYGHLVVTDDARGAISLLDRDTGDKILDYTAGLVYPLRKPKNVATTVDKDLVVTDDDKLIFVDTKQNPPKISTIFGGSLHKRSSSSVSTCSNTSVCSSNTITSVSSSTSRSTSSSNSSKNLNYARPTAIYCDNYNTLLVATKERCQEKINHKYNRTVSSKLKLLTVNGNILCHDVLAEKSIQHVGMGQNGWEEVPCFLDVAVSNQMVYLLGEDKFVHCYKLVRV